MKLINIFGVLITAFLMISCSDEVDQDISITPTNETSIALSIGKPSESTRATQAEENTIKTVTAYLFIAEGQPLAGTFVRSITNVNIKNGINASVKIIINDDNVTASGSKNSKVEVYLVANATLSSFSADGKKARENFYNATISGYDKDVAVSGLAAMKYVDTFDIKLGETITFSKPVLLSRVQARMFVSNTRIVGDGPNGLGKYQVTFKGLADKAVLTHPYKSNFNNVGFNATYTHQITGNNQDSDFYNQEPVAYLYPVPDNKKVTIEVKDPNNNANSTTFSPAFGTNYRIKITPVGVTRATLGVEVEAWKGEEARDRYMVVVVAGQSNAVGYDESPIDLDGLQKINPNAFQLAYRPNYGKNLSIVPLQHCADDMQDMSHIVDKNGRKGAKGIHLPLANELLKRMPKGYKLLVIPVAYGSSSLIGAKNPSRAYERTLLRPAVMNASLGWGVGMPYNRTVIDRVKYALNLHSANKFLGVVWCQGEEDARKSKPHYEAFQTMTQDFFDAINLKHAARCPKGVADKDLWYSYSSTEYWHIWADVRNSSATFGNYKVWNPNTFIHVPLTTGTNAINGTGKTSSERKSHFGNDAYSKVIAPMIAQCMDENGGLFNGTPNTADSRFVEKEIKSKAAAFGGSFKDADIQSGLQLFLPFLNSTTQSTVNNGAFDISAIATISLTDSRELTNINGGARTRKVLQIQPTGGRIHIQQRTSATVTGSWSVAFLIKRTANLNANSQPVIHGTGNNSPFFGYKTFTSSGDDELVGGNVDFIVERIPATTNESENQMLATAGQFIDADNVRSMDQWIHYVVTFNGNNISRIYVNGQLVRDRQLSGLSTTDFTNLYIGNSSTYPTTLGAMVADVGLWNKELSENTIKKLYLYSYYGYEK